MPQKQKVSISPGDRFGMLTVISECGRNKHGHLQYLVRCDCNKEYVVNRNFLFRRKPYLLESEIATQPCGIFYAQKKGL